MEIGVQPVRELILPELGAAPVRLVGTFSPLVARLAQEAGFDGSWISSLEMSAIRAIPDEGLLSLDSYGIATQDLLRASSLPVIVDLGNCDGVSLRVEDAIIRLSTAGASAVCIEDTRFPKSNSLGDSPAPLEGLRSAARRIGVAVRAAEGSGMKVIARVEALVVGCGQTEALRRAEAYMEAGAHMICIHSRRKSSTEVARFCKQWRARSPLLLIPTTYSLSGAQELDLGVSATVFANVALRSMIRSVREALSDLKKTRSMHAISHRMASLPEVFALQALKLEYVSRGAK